jgi:two-component system, LytTR family, response regulator
MPNEPTKLSCNTTEGKIFLCFADISAIEAEGNYAYVHNGHIEKIFVTSSLKDLEIKLAPFGFCRIHRRTLVNILKIHKYIIGEGGYVVMEDGKKYAVSKMGKERLREGLDRVVV